MRSLRGFLTDAGSSARRRSHFCLRAKVTKTRFEYLRQNSLRAKGAPFKQLAASQSGRGALRHFALLVPVDLATSRDAGAGSAKISTLTLPPRSFRRNAGASAAAPQSAAAPSPAFGLTHDSCPNGAPTAQSEFYRVPPNSSALLVTFRAPAKSYSPAGARPGTRPQTKSKR